jgi:5-methylcytosine-specific restriction endonuclease McrA
MDTLSPNTPQDNPNTKRCPKCKNVYLATTEHFYPRKTTRDGLDGWCKQCKRDDTKAYRKQHLEERNRYAAEYKALHREERKLYKDKYNAEHRDQHKRYLEEHSEIISEQQRAYYQEHQDHLKQYTIQYRQTEPGRMSMKAGNHNRKARKKQAGGKHTAQQLQEQYQRQRGKCYYCKVKLSKAWHADHVVPLSKGGSNDISNIVIACPKCNQSKYNKMLHEWIDGGRLL